MKGDFTRVTFDPAKQYTRVLMQQGRVQLDADWNEQADIFQHYLRTLAADLIGPFGAPPEKDGTPGLGFKLVPRRNLDRDIVELSLLPGRYYVDGIAVEDPLGGSLGKPPEKNTLFYLDVWERHITYLQDDLLREVALLGPDTATRSKVVWRVRTDDETPDKKVIEGSLTCRSIRREWSRWVEQWQPVHRGRLKARARPGKPDDTDPCLTSPEARYRGENQLYRVEIHTGGTAGPNGATFKWSADNGSIVFPVRQLTSEGGTTTVTLEHLGRGDGSGLVQDDWVEVVDGEEDLRDGKDPLLQVESVDADRRQVILKGAAPKNLGNPKMLRRWDHRRGIARKTLLPEGVYPVVEGDEGDEWLDLEDGVQIFFAKPEEGTAHVYRSGDYWLIPARVATGDVEWPGPAEEPESRPPHGVEHHFAPLGLVTLKDNEVDTIKDCRTTCGARAVPLTTGIADWQLTAAVPALPAPFTPKRPADVIVHPDSVWHEIPGARWISFSPKRVSTFISGSYTYELRFDLCSCIHRAELWLDLYADNTAVISLNDADLVKQTDPRGFEKQKEPIHGEATGTNPTSGKPWFKAGENVLKIVVTNNEGPTGFVLRGAVEDDCHCG